MSKAILINCPTCDGKVSSNASACPHCGETALVPPPESEFLWVTIRPCIFCDGKAYKKVGFLSRLKCNYCSGTGRFLVYEEVIYGDLVDGEIEKKIVRKFESVAYLDRKGQPQSWKISYFTNADPYDVSKHRLSTARYKTQKEAIAASGNLEDYKLIPCDEPPCLSDKSEEFERLA